MSKNLTQLIEEAHRNTPYHPDTAKFLNDALEDLAMSSSFTRRRKIGVTDGSFDIPDDCLFIRKVAYEGTPIDLYYGQETPNLGRGKPVYWQKDETNIRVFPVPDDGKEVELIFCPRPANMVDNDDLPDYPDAEDALIAYAKWIIYTRFEDVSAAEYWQGQYLIQKAKWLILNGRQHKQARRVQARPYR